MGAITDALAIALAAIALASVVAKMAHDLIKQRRDNGPGRTLTRSDLREVAEDVHGRIAREAMAELHAADTARDTRQAEQTAQLVANLRVLSMILEDMKVMLREERQVQGAIAAQLMAQASTTTAQHEDVRHRLNELLTAVKERS
jgi:hypothetical protein